MAIPTFVLQVLEILGPGMVECAVGKSSLSRRTTKSGALLTARGIKHTLPPQFQTQPCPARTGRAGKQWLPRV